MNYFVMSKLLKYTFLVVLSSFLQKICCLLYFYLSSWDLVLNKLLRNLDLFIISLCNTIAVKWASFARIYLCLIGACLSNILNIVSLKLLSSKWSKKKLLTSLRNLTLSNFLYSWYAIIFGSFFLKTYFKLCRNK